jgi:hypothetical protein
MKQRVGARPFKRLVRPPIRSLQSPRQFRHFYDAKKQFVNFLTLVSLDFEYFFQ